MFRTTGQERRRRWCRRRWWRSVEDVDVHCEGIAEHLPVGIDGAQRQTDLALDLDKSIHNHQAAGGHVYFIGINARISTSVRIEAIKSILLRPRGTRRPL